MGKSYKRKTPPNELLDRYKKEKDERLEQEKIEEEQKQQRLEQEKIDEEQKQKVEKAKIKEELKEARLAKKRLEEEKRRQQIAENRKRKNKKYVTVIVQNEIRETRRKFRVEIKKAAKKQDELTNSTYSEKAENYYQRTYNQLQADKRREELLKTVSKIQEGESEER